MACQVIGPVSPATWKLTASLRPASAFASRTNGSVTLSLHTSLPGSTVTLGLPPNVTGLFVPGATVALPNCSPTWTPSNVTGLVPSALEKRSRACLPHTSGMTIRRNVWSRAPASGTGKANFCTGCADGLPTG